MDPPDRGLRPRIVLADDHGDVLIALTRMLHACCDVVASVSSGSEALEAVREHQPDALIVDLMMPDVDGLEVCRSLKQTHPAIDVIIVTAFDDPQVRGAALECGASAFVSKQLAATTLASTILRIVAQRQVSAAQATNRA